MHVPTGRLALVLDTINVSKLCVLAVYAQCWPLASDIAVQANVGFQGEQRTWLKRARTTRLAHRVIQRSEFGALR